MQPLAFLVVMGIVKNKMGILWREKMTCKTYH